MSQVIDQRVVEMRFDNKQFESAIADTQKSIKDFNKNLDKEFGESNDSLNKLEGTAEKVRLQFGLWDMIKFEALHRVIDDLIDKGERLVKAFTIEPVASGWQKYADKTSAVQTIMSATAGKFNEKINAAFEAFEKSGEGLADKEQAIKDYAELTGKTVEEVVHDFSEIGSQGNLDTVAEQLDYVNSKVEKLNWFSDETSASLTDMTTNIGKFTAAGVDLDTAVTAMQGIATWGYLSGSNMAQMERTMTNLSQALGMGSVRVQDWMSVENAGMATEEFKKMAIETAYEMGELKKDLDGIIYAPNTKAGVDVTTENFRSTLSEGWLTTDVLMATLKEYGKAADALNEIQTLNDHIDTTKDMLDALDEYKKAAKSGDADAVAEAFSAFTVGLDAEKNAYEIEKIREQVELLASAEYELSVKAFKASQEAKTFREAIDATKDAVSTKWMNIFENFFGNYLESKQLWSDVADTLWDIFAAPIDALNKAFEYFHKHEGAEKVKNIITGILESVGALAETVRSVINKLFYGTDDKVKVAEARGKKILNIISTIEGAVKKFKAFITSGPFEATLYAIGQVLQSVGAVFKAVWGIIKTIFGAIKDAVKSFIDNLNIERIAKASEGDEEKVKKIGFISALEWIRDKLEQFAKWLSSSDVMKFIADKVGKFVKFLLGLPGKVNKGFKAITGITIGEAFKKMFDKIKAFFSMIGEGIKKLAGVNTYGELFEKIKEKAIKIFTVLGNFFKVIWAKIKELTKVNSAKELWDKIKTKVADFFNAIRNFFGGKKSKDSLVEAADGVLTAASTSTSKLGKVTDNLKNKFSSINKVPEAITNSKAVQKAPAIWDKAKSILSTVFGKIKEFFVSIGNSKAVKGAPTLWEKIKSIVKQMFQGLVDFIKNIDWGNILMAAMSFKSITKSIARLRVSGAIRDMGYAMVRFGKAVEAFGDASYQFAKSQKKRATASILKSIALIILAIGVSVFLIVNSIKKIASLDKDSLTQGLLVVGGIFAALVAFVLIVMISMKAMSKSVAPNDFASMQKSMAKVFKSVAILLLAITIMVGKLVKSIIKLAKVKDQDALKSSFGMVLTLLIITMAIVVAILVIMKNFSKSTSKEGEKSSSSSKVGDNTAKTVAAMALLLLAFGVVIKLLVSSIIKLAKIKNPSSMWAAAGIVMALMIITLVICGLVLNLVRDDKEGILKDKGNSSVLSKNAAKTIAAIALLIFALGVAIRILVKSMVKIASIKPERLGSAVGILVALIALVLLVAIVLIAFTDSKEMKEGKLSKKSASNYQSLLAIAVVLVAFGVMVAAMAKALVVLSLIKNVKGVLIGMAAILLILAALALILVVAKKIDYSKLLSLSVTLVAIGASMVLMAAAFVILLPVIAALSKFKFGTLAAVAGGILLILAAFAVGGMLLKFALPGLLGFGAFVAILVASIALLSVAVAALAVGLAALGASIVAFSAIIVASQAIIKAAVRVMIETLVVAIEAFIIGLLDILGTVIVQVGKLLTTLIITVCDVIIQSAPKIGEAVTVLILTILDVLEQTVPRIIEVVMELIVALLGAIAENAYPIATALMKILISIFQALADNIAPLVHALADLLVNLFDALAGELPRIMESLGNLLFAIIDNTLGALVKGIFKAFGEALSIFAEAAGSFWEAIKTVDPAAMAAVGTLGEMMLMITAAAVIESLNSLISFGKADSPLVALGKQLSEFAPYLNKFAQDTAGIDAGHVEHVAHACAMLGALATALPQSGGLFQLFTGETMSMTTFGEQLAGFGEAFVTFYNTISTVFPVDGEAVESVANAGATMAGLYNKLPKEGGWVQAIFGEAMGLDKFGQQLRDFGEGFVGFYTVIKKVMPIDSEAVDSVTNAGATLAGLYNKLPREGGWMQKLFGEAMGLDKFGKQLKEFGEGFVGFYNVIKKAMPIDRQAVESVTNAGSALAGLYDHMPKQGGVLQKLFGETMSLDDFGKDLVKFAKGFVDFYKVIEAGNIKGSIVNVATYAASALGGLYDHMPKQGGVLRQLFGEKMSLEGFGQDLVKFAKGFVDFYKVISEETIDESIVKTVSTCAETMATLYDKLPKTNGVFQNIFGGGQLGLDDFGEQLSLFGSGFAAFYKSLPKEIDTGIVDTAKGTAEVMATLYSKLPKKNGHFQNIFGGGQLGLDDFGKQLKLFGAGFRDFYAALPKQVDPNVVEVAKNAGASMAELYSALKANGAVDGSWISSIFGGKSISLDEFGSQLKDFGSGFAAFYSEVQDLNIKESTVESVKNAGLTMVALYNAFNDNDTAWDKIAQFFGAQDTKAEVLNKMCNFIKVLATNIKDIVNNYVKDIDTDKLMPFANSVQVIVESINEVKSIDVNKLSGKISNIVQKITDGFGTLADASSGIPKDGTNAATRFIDNFSNALDPNKEANWNTKRKIADMANTFGNAFKEQMIQKLETIGVNIADGLVNGMNNGAAAVGSAAAGMINNAVVKPMQETAQTHSPSKVTERIGGYIAEGLAIGIKAQAAVVDNASADIAFGAVDTMNEAIKASKSLVENAVDDGSMVITPVLDLTDIQNGAMAISQMMDAAGYSLDGTFDYANKAERSRSADISDPSMISLDKLSGAIEELLRSPQGTISNNFTINSTADPKEIAEEVSRIIENQVIRRQAVWGR